MKRLILPIIVILACSIIYYFTTTVNETKIIAEAKKTLELKEKTFEIKIASDNVIRSKGLSDTESLCDSCGMLFVFEREGVYPFWMKDMNYDLDIIYLDDNKKIVEIFENVKKESYPLNIRNTTSAKYVLEINAGESKSLGLKVGDSARF